MRVAGERVSLLGHRLATTSADTGVHVLLMGKAGEFEARAAQG